jgi:hypothetical protein
MAEYTAVLAQTVSARDSVLFEDAVRVCQCGVTRNVFHRPDTGTVKVRGLPGRCYTRIRVTFGGNIAVPEGGTVEEISLAIAVDGEAMPSTTMLYTPAAVDVYGNVSSFIHVDIPCDCCTSISVVNTSGQDILVQNANMTVYKA